MPSNAPIVTTPVPPTPVTKTPYGRSIDGSSGIGTGGIASPEILDTFGFLSCPPSTVTKLGQNPFTHE